MKSKATLLMFLMALVPSIALAGATAPATNVPTLGEAGLVTLGLGLLGGGMVILRNRRR